MREAFSGTNASHPCRDSSHPSETTAGMLGPADVRPFQCKRGVTKDSEGKAPLGPPHHIHVATDLAAVKPRRKMKQTSRHVLFDR